MVPWPPPLGRQVSRISIELYAKVRHGPSLCYLGRKFEHTNEQNLGEDFFWPKTGLNLSEDLFFFGLYLILGSVLHLILGRVPNPALAITWLLG